MACPSARGPSCRGRAAGPSGLVTEAPTAFGDLDQHPVGGSKVVWVEAAIHASGDGADGLGQPGVEGGAPGGEPGGPGSVGGAAGDQALGFEVEQEPGDLGAIEPKLRLAGEVVVKFGGGGGGGGERPGGRGGGMGWGDVRVAEDLVEEGSEGAFGLADILAGQSRWCWHGATPGSGYCCEVPIYSAAIRSATCCGWST